MLTNTNNPKPLLLLVDDDEEFCKKIRKLLEGEFNLAYLPNLDNFTQKFREIETVYNRRIQLLLLDLNFTNEEKGEGLKFIRSQEGKAVTNKGIPIIVVTSYRPQDSIAEESVAFWTVQERLYKKDFDAAVWVQVIREVLKQKPIRLYLNYADLDIEEVKMFKTQVIDSLKTIYGTRITIDDYTPDDVFAGDIGSKKIQNHLSSSNIILHLLSANLLGEKDANREVVNIYEQTKKYARNVPVLLKNCLWDELEIFKGIIPMPKNKICLFPNDGTISINAAKELKELIDSLK